MDLRHSSVDAPMSAEGAPGTNELLTGFVDLHRTKLYMILELSKNIEKSGMTKRGHVS
jgi:hypothetical protein